MFSGTSVAEFNLQWNHWVVDVQSKIDAKLFISCYNLNLIMKVAFAGFGNLSFIFNFCS